MPNIYDPIKVDDDYFPQHETEQESFYQKLNALPRDIADILLVPETAETLEKISKEKQLSALQSEELSRLVRKITVIDIYLGDIIKEVQNRLSVSEASAKEIANALVSEIFAPALEDLKKLHVEKFGRPSPDIAKAPAAPSQRDGLQQKNNIGTGTGNINNPNNIVNLREK